ncbi:hypothetical protein DIPPA_20606 [Diplonema papillatum]|nr:hypothetical protein DIPPA_20606 [Diplonema papillatum]
MSAKKAGGQKRPRLTHANTKVVDVDANGPFLTWLRRELSGLATELDRPGDNHVFLSDPVGQLGSIYKERIVQPMWLLEMAERARTVYTSLEEFEADLELLCSNCAAFNGRHSHWTQLAEEVLKEGKARSASLRIEQSALLTQYPEEAATLKASALLRLGSHPKASALKATNRFFPAPMTPVAAPRYRVGTTLAVPRAVFEHLLYDWRMREVC